MNMITLFDTLQSLERETGRLYRLIAEQSVVRFPRLVELFNRLAQEEEGHERKVALAAELMQEAERQSRPGDSPAPGGPADPGFDILEEKVRDLDAQLGYIREKQSLFESGLPDWSESRIAAMALDIEEQLRESHTLKEFRFRDRRLADLLDSLFRDDAAHVALLRDWLNRQH